MASLARAMVTTPQELQTLLLGPEALDGDGFPLYAGTALEPGETTARWIAPRAGTWQAVVAQARGPPEIVELVQYRRLLARYPSTHWVFNPPIAVSVRPFVDWGNKGKTKSNRDKGKGKGPGKYDKGHAKGKGYGKDSWGFGKAWDKGYDKGYGKGYGNYDKGFY